MKANDIKGRPVISAAEGERLGSVSRVYLDLDARRVAGFAFDASGGFLQPEWAPQVDLANVQSLGPDALLLAGKESVKGEEIERRYAALRELDELTGRPLITTDGRALGKIAALELDERTLVFTGFEVSHGRFSHGDRVPIADVTVIGRDYVVVKTADAGVPEGTAADATGAGEPAVAPARQPVASPGA